MFNSDLIALTETQLLPNDLHHVQITESLQPFQIFRQDHNTDKYLSMAICIKNTFAVKDHEYVSSLNALKFVLTDNIQQSCSFLLLYRKNNSNISMYLEVLEYILNSSKIDIVFGDFNINYLNQTQCQPLISLMESLGYTQIVTEPTFVSSGSLLDHVYVKTTVQVVQNYVASVYYSDHDAVVTTVQYCP